jgi:hypothetical protein
MWHSLLRNFKQLEGTEHSSDQLRGPHIGAFTKHYCNNSGQCMYHLIIQHLSSPMGATLKEFYCTLKTVPPFCIRMLTQKVRVSYRQTKHVYVTLRTTDISSRTYSSICYVPTSLTLITCSISVFWVSTVTSLYTVFPLQVLLYFNAVIKDNFASLADNSTFIPRHNA